MKVFLTVLALLIIVGGVGFVVLNNQDDPIQEETSGEATQQQEGDGASAADSGDVTTGDHDPNNYTRGAVIGASVDATDQTSVTVSIDDNIFETTYLKIKKGTKVTWVNNGNMLHDVTSNSASPKGGLQSELLSNGQSYEFVFEETGIYEYFCTPHSNQMRGVVTVVD